MKTIKTLREVADAATPAAKRFKKKHVTIKHDDVAGNKDDIYQATNIKTAERTKERHGYEPGADAAVYENAQQQIDAWHDQKKQENVKRSIGYIEAKLKITKDASRRAAYEKDLASFKSMVKEEMVDDELLGKYISESRIAGVLKAMASTQHSPDELKAGTSIRTKKMSMLGKVVKVEPHHVYGHAVFFKVGDGRTMRTPISNVRMVKEDVEELTDQIHDAKIDAQIAEELLTVEEIIQEGRSSDEATKSYSYGGRTYTDKDKLAHAVATSLTIRRGVAGGKLGKAGRATDAAADRHYKIGRPGGAAAYKAMQHEKTVTDKFHARTKARVLKVLNKEETELTELSNTLLARYKKKAGEQASAEDKKGNYKKADKRFSGIVKATNKQFDNDTKELNKIGEEVLPSVKTLTPKQIADKHDTTVEAIEAQMKKGIAVEKEHTKDAATAREIALDHLKENPKYYDKLGKMEKSMKKEEVELTEAVLDPSTLKSLKKSGAKLKERAEELAAGSKKDHFDYHTVGDHLSKGHIDDAKQHMRKLDTAVRDEIFSHIHPDHFKHFNVDALNHKRSLHDYNKSMAAKPKKLKEETEMNEAKEACGWFARCKNPATGATPHPILGMVPTCDRCHKFATGESRAASVDATMQANTMAARMRQKGKKAVKEEVEQLEEGRNPKETEYRKARSDVQWRLHEIEKALKDHQAKAEKGKVHFAHVGDMERVHSDLKQAHRNFVAGHEYIKRDHEHQARINAAVKGMKEEVELTEAAKHFAHQEYLKAHKDIAQRLSQIRDEMAEHHETAKANGFTQGHTGHLTRLHSELKHIHHYLTNQGEYGPQEVAHVSTYPSRAVHEAVSAETAKTMPRKALDAYHRKIREQKLKVVE